MGTVTRLIPDSTTELPSQKDIMVVSTLSSPAPSISPTPKSSLFYFTYNSGSIHTMDALNVDESSGGTRHLMRRFFVYGTIASFIIAVGYAFISSKRLRLLRRRDNDRIVSMDTNGTIPVIVDDFFDNDSFGYSDDDSDDSSVELEVDVCFNTRAPYRRSNSSNRGASYPNEIC